jgi:HEAT repeat protein
MRGLMVDAWLPDLSNPSADKRINAAKELGNMGPAAKSALPALEKLASDKNPSVAAAAKSAIAAIRK